MNNDNATPSYRDEAIAYALENLTPYDDLDDEAEMLAAELFYAEQGMPPTDVVLSDDEFEAYETAWANVSDEDHDRLFNEALDILRKG